MSLYAIRTFAGASLIGACLIGTFYGSAGEWIGAGIGLAVWAGIAMVHPKQLRP